MNYMTNFKLSIEKSDNKTRAIDVINYILKRQQVNPNVFRPFNDDIKYHKNHKSYGNYHELDLGCNFVKWDSYDVEMKELSVKFPGVTFKLHGVGEEYGDVWDTYYKKGNSVRYDAIVMVPPLNENDLK